MDFGYNEYEFIIKNLRSIKSVNSGVSKWSDYLKSGIPSPRRVARILPRGGGG